MPMARSFFGGGGGGGVKNLLAAAITYLAIKKAYFWTMGYLAYPATLSIIN